MTETTAIAVKINSPLPNIIVKDKSITDSLSTTHWTLIVCGKEKIKFQIPQLKILHVPENTYNSRYILIKPDQHVAMADSVVSQHVVMQYLKRLS